MNAIQRCKKDFGIHNSCVIPFCFLIVLGDCQRLAQELLELPTNVFYGLLTGGGGQGPTALATVTAS